MTTELWVVNATIAGEHSTFRGWVQCVDGVIADMGQGRTPTATPPAHTIDADGMPVLPGFIDVHVHGADGYDVMDGSVTGLQQMAAYLVKTGVTAFTPTTLTATHEQTLSALMSIQQAMAQASTGAVIVGAHLEGPYLNVKKCGAQNPAQVRPYDRAEAAQYFDMGVLKIVSLAPEIEGNMALIDRCIEEYITASIAHSDATYEETVSAIERGIQQSTHTFNAMRGLHHRSPGVVGAVLTDSRVRCEVIADNHHVHPAVMQLIWQAKGRDRVILVTDAMRAMGKGDGHYKLGELDVHVADGKATLPDGKATLPDGTLAGSVLTMDAALRNLSAATGMPLAGLWRCASLNPARVIGLGQQKGSIAIGKDADLVVLDVDNHVWHTIVGGEVVYSA